MKKLAILLALIAAMSIATLALGSCMNKEKESEKTSQSVEDSVSATDGESTSETDDESGSESGSGSESESESGSESEPTTVYYTIAYDANDGTPVEDAEAAEGTKVSDYTDAVTTKQGYTFVKWQIADGEDYRDVTEADEVNADVSLKAVWTPLTYTVTFKANGETVATREYNVESFEIEEPEVPEVVGFDGAWEEYTLNFGAETEMTVNAVYTEKEFTVSFVNADGSELQSGSVKYGATPEYEGEDPSAQGIFEMIFNGWDKEIVAVTEETTYTATYTKGAPVDFVGYAACDNGWFRPCYKDGGNAVMYDSEDPGYSFYYLEDPGAIFSGAGIAVSNAIVAEAKAAGYNYLEIAVGAEQAWMGADLLPAGDATVTITNQSYSDMVPGKEYLVVDLTNIETDEGYSMIGYVNQYSVRLYNAKFTDKPITENENFASAWFCYESTFNKYYADSNGKGGFKWAQGNYSFMLPFVGVNIAREEGYSTDTGVLGTEIAAGHATDQNYMKAAYVRMAKAAGFTKMAITVCVKGTDKVYYWPTAREWESNIKTEGAWTDLDENGIATVYIDISEYDDGWSYLTLPAIEAGYIAYLDIHFTTEGTNLPPLVLTYDGDAATDISCYENEEIDWTKFGYIGYEDGYTAEWTLNDETADMTAASALTKGEYVLKLTIKSGEEVVKTKSVAVHVGEEKYADFSKDTQWVSAATAGVFGSGTYDESASAMVGTAVSIDNALIAQAKKHGCNYLFVEAGASGEQYVYANLYVGNDTTLGSGNNDTAFYSHSGRQTYVIDFSDFTLINGYTDLIKGSVDCYVYSAKFVETIITEDVNYACQIYQYYSPNRSKKTVWAGSANDNIWDFRTVDGTPDVMQLHFEGQTLCFRTEFIQLADSLGFTAIKLQLSSSTDGAVVYYTASLDNTYEKTADNHTDEVAFSEDGTAEITISITNSDVIPAWVAYLASASEGDMVVNAMYFVK